MADPITTPSIAEIVAQVAAAMKDAAAEYGPQAADLALLAYRVDAIKSLLLIPVAGGILYGAWRGWKWLWRASADWCDPPGKAYRDTFPRDIARILSSIGGGVGGFFLAAITIDRVIDLPLWMAAFGAPELLIATRALEAAGLM